MAQVDTTKYDDQVANAASKVTISSTVFKAFIANLKDVIDQNSPEGMYDADSGTTDAYAVTLDPAPSAYFEGMTVRFKANTANTGACTLDVNSLGAKTIKKNVSDDMETGDIAADQIIVVVYDGTNFQFVGPATGELAKHKAEDVTDAGGVHGLEITSGTFTPTVVGSSVAGANTYSVQQGYYTKINKIIHFDLYVSISAKDVAMSGSVLIGGLPEAGANVGDRRPAFSISTVSQINKGNTNQITANLTAKNTTTISLMYIVDNGNATALDATEINGTFTIRVSGTYEVN